MICPLCNRALNKPLRSLSQNRIYWLYLGIIERDTGNLASDLNEYYKRTLLPPKFITINGREIKIPSSTKELDKIEMSEYLTKISIDCEIPVPEPHDLEGYFCGKKSCNICVV